MIVSLGDVNVGDEDNDDNDDDDNDDDDDDLMLEWEIDDVVVLLIPILFEVSTDVIDVISI